ncbi:peptidase M23 [Sphingopyxis sp. H038]|uniref:M23 family metallopeptidase n=1 Tax=unclassified Sphingopyxis TaxID=2614943 RepID=UPI000731777B|nr:MULTISPECIES: M23 family metallopeptidase [unclassified Sphingopyxis]KTE03734.1 peptidase M23 [Sphingopyxis sp. H012]KTE09192.1 peptidase M23 [Sphingopyxis sp. H053]KTE14839.1 peptidase M23 [Sphingopyxis sp. H093]KTE29226.1 peptidase M23 [Sphingopyxis sp. H080]KTE35062.1 peptidase M23 [Sphingopyxis sp. H038]
MSSKTTGLRDLRQRFSALFQDHEIFVRTHGHVRFVRVSAIWQKRVALIAGIVLLAWAGATLAVLVNQLLSSGERAAVAQQQAAAAASEARIAKYRNNVAETAADLEDRQEQLEEWSKVHFGVEPAAVTPEAHTAGAAPAAEQAPLKTSALIDPNLPPEAQILARLEARQEDFATRLLTAVNERAAKAEGAVAKLGMNPAALVRNAAAGRGGPFIPYRGGKGRASSLGKSFAALESALFRMEVLERTLVALPSGKPANVLMLSSSYGYRSDPFTGAGAMHSGLDFPGPMGSPILAAAPGRVVYVGQKSGYGNVVEVDHGQGILTRYAHLSGFTSTVGAQVAAGQQIAKMGSTGRSTGSHLHFEVRLNGVAVNPRRFLEAKADVLEVKDDARQRVGSVAAARGAR